VVATRGRTPAEDVRRTAQLLRRAGVGVGAAVLQPHRAEPRLGRAALRRLLGGMKPAASSR